MKTFITADFLLDTPAARKLYHECAETLPIVDIHNHLDPHEIAENKTFENIGEAWLAADHYKWRAMRACGVDENFITGNASWREKFEHFAAIMPRLIGNPVYHWAHLELARYFNFNEPLCAENAAAAWDAANAILPKTPAQTLIAASKVEALCTTDFPADSLKWHRNLGKNPALPFKVLPTFRPDRLIHIENPDFKDAVEKLAAAANKKISTIEDIADALDERCERFLAFGCKLSDQSFAAPDFTVWSIAAARESFNDAMDGKPPRNVNAFYSWIMRALCEIYARRGLTMQLHIGAERNFSTRLYKTFGADAGGDAIADPISPKSLAAMLDRAERSNYLPRTIVYTLNPAANYALAATIGCFQGVTFGPAWWFNDHIDGIDELIKTFANLGAIGTFIGMLTDSRSFLSWPRHEYFRRILCRRLGNWVSRGLVPDDFQALAKLTRDICYENAKSILAN